MKYAWMIVPVAAGEVRIYDYDLDSVEVRRRFESFPTVPIIPR